MKVLMIDDKRGAIKALEKVLLAKGHEVVGTACVDVLNADDITEAAEEVYSEQNFFEAVALPVYDKAVKTADMLSANIMKVKEELEDHDMEMLSPLLCYKDHDIKRFNTSVAQREEEVVIEAEGIADDDDDMAKGNSFASLPTDVANDDEDAVE